MTEQAPAEEKPPFRTRIRPWLHEYLTSVFAGLSPTDLREMFQGEEPARPNPRYKPHNISFWVHMKPRWYWESVTKFTYTFALGWLSVFFAVVLGVTGFLLMLFYKPSVDTAYFDILEIMGNVPFGKLMRDVHRLGAELMVAIVALHMLRVFVTASYKQPRSFNWTVGVVLLLTTMLFSYTGYLLPWDQLAYWAVTIGASMADSIPVIGANIQALLFGGAEIGQLGLIRLYTLHVAVLPAVLAIMFGVHYHKVVRQQISQPPSVDAGERKDTERVAFLPDVLSREALWTLGALLITVIAVVTFFEAPLEDHADPFVTPLHATAPWYFLWIQGLIKLPDIFGGIIEGKFIYGVIIPGFVFTFLFLLPYVDRNPSRRPQDRRIALGVGAVVLAILAILTWMGTPAYKAQATPEMELALEFVPYDREGRIHEVPWNQLVDGTYSTAAFEEGSLEPAGELDALMTALQEEVAEIEERFGFENAVATITIQTWQRELKRIDLDMTWMAGGAEDDFNQYTYIHQNRAEGPAE
ncbi:MAG TPA: cytochrome bc complex cytochrome b subunit [Anaerolineae bacterium]|nr:cytochrome bc complex cytochrome b subunit [Anaerolineae bacterium]